MNADECRSTTNRWRYALAWVVCVCGLAVRFTTADEAGLVGVGGTYRPMRGESEVRLVREFVRIEISPRVARTVVQFEFRNEGPPQIVIMGFPEQVVYDRRRYERFEAEADGRPLAAAPTRWVEESPNTRWARWWVSKVPFAQGERRIIRVRYQERPATGEMGYTYRYIFGTGRSWQGPIGRVDVLMLLDGFPPEATLSVNMPELTRKANRLAWRFENWEPEEDVALDLAVSPYITNVAFDSEVPDPPAEWNLRRGHLDAYLGDIAFWVEGSLAWSPRERIGFIHRKGNTLVLTVGSEEALLLPESTRVRLPFAPYLAGSPSEKGNRLRVPVRAVCEALGLRVHAEKDEIGNCSVYVSGIGARHG